MIPPPPPPESRTIRAPRPAGAACWAVGMVAFLLAWLVPPGPATGQGLDFTGRPIRQIEIIGLEQIESRLVENQLRSQLGRPYDNVTAREDTVRLTNLGYFGSVTARAVPRDDGGVVLQFVVEELPLLTGIEIRGNRDIATAELRPLILLRPGDAVDPFLIDRARQALAAAYEAEGYFVTDISIDQEALDRDRRLVFLIREGPRIRLRRIDFEGNAVFDDRRLIKQIRSSTWKPIIGSQNVLNREELELDASRLRQYYQDRGYLEAEVDRRITVSNDQRDATVTFLISEGPQWTVNDVRVEGLNGQPLIFSAEQLKLNMALQPGDVFTGNKLRRSSQQILDLYGKLGYLDTRLVRRNATDSRTTGIDRLFNPENNTVDLLVTVDQGVPSRVGKVTVRGNGVTRTKVVLRELRGITPGRPFDRTQFARTERRLNETPLFSAATITLLGDAGDKYRDVLIEVGERNTGSINFGVTVSSDSGLLGAIDITQRNFDITDLPESLDDLISNRAFRGGGQRFNLALQPGSDNSRYAIGLSDPYFFDTDYFFDSSFAFSDTDRDRDFDEQRLTARLGLGKRFGDVWSASARLRGEDIRIADIDADGPLDVFAVEGDNTLTSVSAQLIRDTTDSNLFPTRGSRMTLGAERVGALGGDFDFTKLTASYDKFWTISEDFLERKSVLRLRLDGGYILEPGESPLFERFFAGGQSTFRGFENRGVGPRGIQADTLTLGDEAVGGDFLLLAGLQYDFPLVDNYLRGVVFTDQGTLNEEFSIDDWRVSVGFGIRIQVAFLSQAPFAIDYSIPLLTEETDEERAISFAIDIPFQ
ncbi:MAG: POTRA domain-containing protein [Planctomycetota bacterium]